MENATERKAANILLQRGVKVQVATPLFFGIFGNKKIEIEIKAPSTEKFLEIALLFLDMNIQNTGG